jgi:hypothetical protein
MVFDEYCEKSYPMSLRLRHCLPEDWAERDGRMAWMVCSTCALGAASREDYGFYRKSKAGMIEWQQSELRFNISP